MKKMFAVLALGSAFTLPVLAQMTPAETNMDKSAARMEALADLNPSQAIAQIGSWKLDLGSNTFSATEEGLRIFGLRWLATRCMGRT